MPKSCKKTGIMLLATTAFNVLVVILLTTSNLADSEYRTYKGYKIYEVKPRTLKQTSQLQRFHQRHREYVDFLTFSPTIERPTRVLVSPESEEEIKLFIKTSAVEYKIINSEVSETILEHKSESDMIKRTRSARSEEIAFDTYYRFDEINRYLAELAGRYPARVFLKNVGQSFEGRQLSAIRITNGDGQMNKKVIFIDAGIHAREWIAPATALYVIKQLTENFEENSYFLLDYDWLVLPVANPDGYEYTHTNERFWRKTRQPSRGLRSVCVGVDPNRNFAFHWGETGTSSLACSEIYKGPHAFSEPETAVLREMMHSVNETCKMYLTLHSYGNYLLYPWGYTSKLPDTWKDLDEVAKSGADAIANATGTLYTVGSSTNVLYAASGGSDDYAFAKAKIPIAITMELPAGGSGFDPPPSKIKSFAEESWIGIKAMAKTVSAKY